MLKGTVQGFSILRLPKQSVSQRVISFSLHSLAGLYAKVSYERNVLVFSLLGMKVLVDKKVNEWRPLLLTAGAISTSGSFGQKK